MDNKNNNKYEDGKIYKIVDNTNGNYYIGSTTRTLDERLSEHEKKYRLHLVDKYNNVTSFDIIKNGNYKIKLILNYSCESKQELFKKETEYIKNSDDKCVNKCLPQRTLEQYYQDNKEKLIAKQKEYYKKKSRKENRISKVICCKK